MANERLPPQGLTGHIKALKHLLGTELSNAVKASSIRQKYGLDRIAVSGANECVSCDIAIVAIFKGEDEYLREWIEFHRTVGVDHFFLYDNGDSVVSRSILEPYIQDGSVTYIPFPDIPERGIRRQYGKDQFRRLSLQNLAYGHCSRNYASKCNWLIKIDLDEFMYPLEPYQSLADAFIAFEKPQVKGFSVQAMRFGPSGQLSRSGLTLMETYRKRNPEPDRNWKAVARGTAVSTFFGYQGCHTYFYRPVFGAKHLTDTETCNLVRINHYYIKSKDEYLDKIEKHASGHKAGKETAEKWPVADAMADHLDEGQILRFLPILKMRLGIKS
ncbi:MAG: glycosyltransferase family 92 protein [Spirochaetota bacterium]